jgi:hypothetical protein
MKKEQALKNANVRQIFIIISQGLSPERMNDGIKLINMYTSSIPENQTKEITGVSIWR